MKVLARGRQEAKVVRNYLEALHTDGQRGRPIDRQSLEARIERLQSEINEESNAARRVELIQQRPGCRAKVVGLEESTDPEALERDFIEVGKSYSQRRGITYTRLAGSRRACCSAARSRDYRPFSMKAGGV